MGGIIKLVAQVDSGRYKTIRQVADTVGRDVSTIRHAIRYGRIPGYEGPTHKMLLGDGSGKSFVWLYTDDDINTLRAYFAKMPFRPGPGRKKEGKA